MLHRLSAARVQELILFAVENRGHKGIGDRHTDIEVGDFFLVGLAGDEFQNVRVIHAEDAHIRPAPRAALLDVFGGLIVDLHERHRA